MPKIFLSHTRDDDADTRRVGEFLEEVGFKVWIDHRLGAGNFREEIARHLDTSDWLVIILSPSALVSVGVREEVEYVLDLMKRQKIQMIPFLIKECDESDLAALLPSYLNRVEAFIDRDYGLRALLAFIRGDDPPQRPLFYAGSVRSLLPSRYEYSHVGREDLVNVAYLGLKEHAFFFLVGEAGVGKSCLAYETANRLIKDSRAKFVVSINWVDIMASSRAGARLNLFNELRTALPGFENSTSTSIEQLTHDEQNLFSNAVFVFHNLEIAGDSWANRDTTDYLIGQLASVPCQGNRRPWMLFTTRPTQITLWGEDFDLTSVDRKKLPEEALWLEKLSKEQGKTLVALHIEDLATRRIIHDSTTKNLLKTAISSWLDDRFTPLELKVLCETVGLAAESGVENADLERVFSLLRLDDEDFDEDNLVYSVLSHFYPILRLYATLWGLLKPAQRESLGSVLEFFSLGLTQTRAPVQLGAAGESLSAFIEMPRENRYRTTAFLGLELAHPIVSLLPTILTDLSLPERGSGPYASLDETCLSDLERLIWTAHKALESGESLTNIGHEVAEEEARAVTFLMAHALGAEREVMTVLSLPRLFSVDEKTSLKPAEQALVNARKLLHKRIAKIVGDACRRKPGLTLTAARLAEVLYQRLDEWELKDAILDVLWADRRRRPTCVVKDQGTEWAILSWYVDPGELLTDAGLGAEYLRQLMLVRYLEASSLPDVLPPLDALTTTRKMEAWMERIGRERTRDAILAFANFCDLAAVCFSQRGDPESQLQLVSISRKCFLVTNSPADAMRTSLQAVNAERLFPTLTDTVPAIWTDYFAPKNVAIPLVPFASQEEIYLRVLLGYVHLAAAFGYDGLRPSQEAVQHLRVARSLLNAANALQEESSGDEWMSYQLKTILFGLRALELQYPDTNGFYLSRIPINEWEDFVGGAQGFYDRIGVEYCSSVLLWDDLILVCASEARRPAAIREVLAEARVRLPWFLFPKAYGTRRQQKNRDRFADVGERTRKLLVNRLQLGERVSYHLIAYSAVQAAEQCLTRSQCQEVLSLPLVDDNGRCLLEILDEDATIDPTLGSWREVIERLCPGLAKNTTEHFALPPIAMVEALIYRGIPKGLRRVAS